MVVMRGGARGVGLVACASIGLGACSDNLGYDRDPAGPGGPAGPAEPIGAASIERRDGGTFTDGEAAAPAPVADASPGPPIVVVDAPAVKRDAPVVRLSDGKCPDLDGNGVADCHESLVANPDFDGDVEGWGVEAGGAQAFLPLDAEGDAASGALSVKASTVSPLDGEIVVGTQQCLPVTAAVYRLVFEGRVGSSLVKAGASVFFYPGDACGGTRAPSQSLILTASTGWAPVRDTINVPAGTRSLRLRLIAIKQFKDPPQEVFFDNVLFVAGAPGAGAR